MNNQLPINKIFLAGFAFIFTHWQKILEISIFPLLVCMPFLLIAPDLLGLIHQPFNSAQLSRALPDNVIIYLILFFYGYLTLSINMYRLIMLGKQSVFGLMPVLEINKIVRFIGLILFVGLATMVPVLITGIGFLQLAIYFLIIPITLNFINIALGQPSKYKWNLSFVTHVNLFFLQVILPALITILFSILDNALGLGSVLSVGIKVVVFYWTLVTLALCYKAIHETTKASNNSMQNL